LGEQVRTSFLQSTNSMIAEIFDTDIMSLLSDNATFYERIRQAYRSNRRTTVEGGRKGGMSKNNARPMFTPFSANRDTVTIQEKTPRHVSIYFRSPVYILGFQNICSLTGHPCLDCGGTHGRISPFSPLLSRLLGQN